MSTGPEGSLDIELAETIFVKSGMEDELISYLFVCSRSFGSRFEVVSAFVGGLRCLWSPERLQCFLPVFPFDC